MATLPPTEQFTGNDVTEGQFKTALHQMIAYLTEHVANATAHGNYATVASLNAARTALQETIDTIALTPGPRGPAPAHRWNGDALEIQNPDDTWDTGVNLRGEPGEDGRPGLPPTHEWDGYSLRIRHPDDSWGSFVYLRGAPGQNGGSSGSGGGDISG